MYRAHGRSWSRRRDRSASLRSRQKPGLATDNPLLSSTAASPVTQNSSWEETRERCPGVCPGVAKTRHPPPQSKMSPSRISPSTGTPWRSRSLLQSRILRLQRGGRAHVVVVLVSQHQRSLASAPQARSASSNCSRESGYPQSTSTVSSAPKRTTGQRTCSAPSIE